MSAAGGRGGKGARGQRGGMAPGGRGGLTRGPRGSVEDETTADVPTAASSGYDGLADGGSFGFGGFASYSSPALAGHFEPPPPPPPPPMMVTTMGGQRGAGFAGFRPFSSFFVSESLHEELRARSAAVHKVSDPNDPTTSRFPHVLHGYHSFVALEALFASQSQSKVFGCATEVYKATSQLDGSTVCVRSVPYARPSIEQAQRACEAWSTVVHPNVVQWRSVFASKVVSGVPSLFCVYDYYPCAVTLQACYLDGGRRFEPLDEPTLWCYVLQLVSALRAIHAAGLACRVVHPCKILLTGRQRVRLNCVGVADVLAPGGGGGGGGGERKARERAQQQHDDLYALGKLILSLTTGADFAGAGAVELARCVHIVEAAYSADVAELVRLLLKSQQGPKPTIGEVVSMLAPRLLDHADALHGRADLLEAELAKEMENGRLFRLAAKLGFVNERPEFDMDPSWSETGNRYLLKLFRDYTFHQVNHDRTPNLDYSHVVDTLNKLDVGSSEKLVLSARDAQSFLVVSYKDVRHCLDQAFNELLDAYRRTHMHPESM